MPGKCSVPLCRGNYCSGQKVSVFSFPKENDLKKKWIWRMKRLNFIPTKNSRVCELHFNPDEIERTSEMFDEDTGRHLSVPLAKPRLKKGAVPCRFPEGPSYLSSPMPSGSRETPDQKKLRMEMDALNAALELSKKEKEEYDSRMSFNNFIELKLKIEKETLPQDWSVVCNSDNIWFLKIRLEPSPVVQHSLVVDTTLNTTAYIKNVPINTISNIHFPTKFDNINSLLNILQELDCISPASNGKQSTNESVSTKVSFLEDLLTDLINLIPGKQSEIFFIKEQISKLQLDLKQYRYSMELMVFCSLLYSISPHAYKFLRGSGNIVIPHPGTIHRICNRYINNPLNERIDENFLSYVKQRFVQIEDKERYVIVMIDEIHLKAYYDFKGGNICGMAYNKDNAASSAHIFMIRSLLSSFQEVAHILPVKTISATDLFQFLKKVIIGLEDIGFLVIAVVSDNNSINKKAMSMFHTPSKISITYQHPVNNSRPLFFLIDSVHILKCVRNNWINQKNDGQCLFFPKFGECQGTLQKASFKTVKKLHEIESSKLVKYGYGLTLKALHPNNLERQNVQLALQIFNYQVAEGLCEVAGEDENFVTTSDFIKIISKWWSVVNVKTPLKGFHKNDPYQRPLTLESENAGFHFLGEFLEWMDGWDKINRPSSGNLTKETHFALSHTTYALREMASYCISELNFKYFLPGKVQTDILEHRFGKYRQLAGGQHNISIRQVYETETKLRLQSILPHILKSSKFGGISIHLQSADEITGIDECNEAFQNLNTKISVTEEDFVEVKNDMPILTYVAGYVSYITVKKLKCDICKINLTVDREFLPEEDTRWIKKFDRGLKYPHPDVLNAVVYTFLVVQKLISSTHEQEFLNVKDHRIVVCNLTLNILKDNMFYLDLEGCSHEADKVLKQIVYSSTNVFLNNYCKKRNDNLSTTKSAAKQRKLITLS